MIKGDKIKLVKTMGAFTNVGEICEVVDITEGGVIHFKFGKYHLGCMSYDEYEKYFEQVEFTERKEWSDWSEKRIWFYDMGDDKICELIRYRHNGKKVQVRCGSLKTESSCNKVDNFNLGEGLYLATKRLIVKLHEEQVKELAKEM